MQVNEVLPAASVQSLEALRALSDGQRHRIMTLLIDEALTATELATRLGIGRTRLYYHLALLERNGLVRVVDTRMVSGIQERRYRSVARVFRVDRGLLGATAGAAEISNVQASIVDAVAADLHASAALQDEELLVSRAFLRLTPQRRSELRERLAALVQEYREPDAGGAELELGIALFRTEGTPTP